jgi:putative endonuclease
MTNDLIRRIAEHRSGMEEGFASKYEVRRLLHFEETTNVFAALTREKQLKGWSRRKKIDLIRSMNPLWKDLSAGW